MLIKQFKKYRFLAILLSTLITSSCFKPTWHGYDFSDDFKTESTITTQMYKFDVINLMGEPSFSMGDNDYFVSIKQVNRAFLKDKIQQTRYVIVTYDANQKVTSVKIKK